MKIYGGEELSEAQIEAGLDAMNGQKGRFSGFKVMSALRRAGVTYILSGAEVLIGRELRLGHIRRVTRGHYERTKK